MKKKDRLSRMLDWRSLIEEKYELIDTISAFTGHKIRIPTVFDHTPRKFKKYKVTIIDISNGKLRP